MSRSIGKRASDILVAAGVRPFADWPLEWRASPDVRDQFLDTMPKWPGSPDRYTWDGEDRVFGYRLNVDETLPPNALLLEKR